MTTGTTGTTTTGGGQCVTFDYSTYTAGATMRTLEDDVKPIFTMSCALSIACHSSGGHPPTLGGGMSTTATISAAIVDQPSTEVPTWKYVAKGMPDMSYLMRKVEDPVPGCGLACTPPTGFATACTDMMGRMPQGGPYLTPAQESVIRDWIKQGAN